MPPTEDENNQKKKVALIGCGLIGQSWAVNFLRAGFTVSLFDPVEGVTENAKEKIEYKRGARSYLILPKFVTSSATSFEKFADGIKGIVKSIEGLEERLAVSIMHPEHVEKDKRSPVPVLVIQWYDEK